MDIDEATMTQTPVAKTGYKRPIPGTPLGKENPVYDIFSPTGSPDAKTTKTEPPQPTTPQLQGRNNQTFIPPSTPPHSHAATPATLADIAQLLQSQLAPITKELGEVKSSMQSTMQGLKDELKHQIDGLDEQLTQL